MNHSFIKVPLALLCSAIFLGAIASSALAQMQASVSATDKAFIEKATQSELYALAASKHALDQADSSDVKDLAWIEDRDHQKIMQELKTIATANHVPITSKLDAEFQERLNRLKAASGRDLDIAFLKDMTALHFREDELFAEEATSSVDSPYKTFAAKTDVVLKRHIDALADADTKN